MNSSYWYENDSFSLTKNFLLFSVILGLPCITVQCSDLWLCFCKLIDDFEFMINSLIKKLFPRNKFVYFPQGLLKTFFFFKIF